jgi:hypothetical protein
MTIFLHRIIGLGSGGEQWVTTLHTSSVGGLAAAAAAWNAFGHSIFVSALAALWDPNVTSSEYVTDQLDPITGKSVGQSRHSNVNNGTSVGVPLSPRDCVVVSLRTDRPGPGGRGRMYWPAPTSLSIDDTGKLTSDARDAFSGLFGAHLTTLAGSTVPVVYHRPTVERTTYDRRTGVATDHPASLATAIPITNVLVGYNLGSQRRRTNKTTQVYESVAI